VTAYGSTRSTLPTSSAVWPACHQRRFLVPNDVGDVDVLYDQVTGDRFRHGTRLLRWRPDKSPGQCLMEQMIHEVRPAELATMNHAPGARRK
jgi:hypothetical protein